MDQMFVYTFFFTLLCVVNTLLLLYVYILFKKDCFDLLLKIFTKSIYYASFGTFLKFANLGCFHD